MNNSPTVSSTPNVREKHAVFLADFKMILFVSMVEVRKITFTYTYALIALTGSVDTSSGTRAGQGSAASLVLQVFGLRNCYSCRQS